ncbi:MAG: PAS domain S-box protein [Deltaproteobacteria bacterium]|nr:PAS domain S-box protein [Deltaproteobacteria bacterium]
MDDSESNIIIDNVLESMSDGLIVILPDGTIPVVNEAALNILGHRREEYANAGWGEIFLSSGDNLEFNQVLIDVIYDRKLNYYKETLYVTPQGQIKHLGITTSYLRDLSSRNQHIGIVLLIKDVTELVELRREEQAYAEELRLLDKERIENLNQIAMSVAHEIRNPAASIGGFANLMLRKLPPDGPYRAYLENILAGSKRLEQIVRLVGEYAEISKPRPTLILLEDLVKASVLELYGWPEIGSKIALVVMVDEGAEVYADQQLMLRVLGILFQNAWEAMPQGGTITIEGKRIDKKSTLSVTDTGVGIKQGDIPFIFNPFFSTRPLSVGMGLTIARKIIFDHKGSINLESRPNQGTSVIITLPATPPVSDQE